MARVDEERPERIGRYRVIDEIGRGGQGVVYRVHDEEHGVDLALKVLPPGPPDPDLVERMRREVLLSGRVRHDGICRIHGLQNEDGRTFVLMDLVAGTPLDKLIDKGALPIKQALKVMGALAEAVAAVHAVGVIHRDLKPDNVIVGPDGPVVIVDFGVATAGDQSSLTAVGAVVGTRRYIPPERWAGAAATPLSDVFALGVLLYECLTGADPYASSSRTSTLTAKGPQVGALTLPRFIPPSERNPSLPNYVDDVVRRAMAAAPQDRTPSAHALAIEIRAIEERVNNPTAMVRGEPSAVRTASSVAPPPPAPAARAIGARAILLALGGALVAGAAVVWLTADAPVKKPQRVDADAGSLPRTDAGVRATVVEPVPPPPADVAPPPLPPLGEAPPLAELDERARALGVRRGDVPSFDTALERLAEARTDKARERAQRWAAAALQGHVCDATIVERKLRRVRTTFESALQSTRARAQPELDAAVGHIGARQYQAANTSLNAVLDVIER
jgi:serine/threonine-protein kinase